jgi:hypothetical protein
VRDRVARRESSIARGLRRDAIYHAPIALPPQDGVGLAFDGWRELPVGNLDANYRLFLAAMAYAGLNVVVVFLCCGGIIHPPFDVLTFFSFVGPPAMAAVVLILRLAAVRFDTAALVVFLVVMVLMALLNVLVFGEMVAAV